MCLGESLRSRLDPNFAVQDVPPQSPVAHQTEPGVFERCRLVALEKEVADPGEYVSLDDTCHNPPPPLRGNRRHEQRDDSTRRDEAHTPPPSADLSPPA